MLRSRGAALRTRLSAVCAGIIEAGWLTAAIVVPLAFNAHAARGYEPFKVVLLRSLVGVMALAWLVLALEERTRPAMGSGVIKRLRHWLALPLVVPVLLFSASYAVSTLFSIDPTHSVWGSFDRLQGTYSTFCYVALFGFIAGYLRTREQIDRLVAAIILSSLPVAVYAILQYLGLSHPDATGGIAATGTLGNPIFLSSYLSLVVPLTLARIVISCAPDVKHGAVKRRQIGAALFYGAVLAAQATAILFSGSRGPVVGLAGAGFVAGAVALPRIRHWLWVPWIGAGVLGMLLVVVNLAGLTASPIFAPIREAPYVERVARVLDSDDPTSRVRVLLWDAAAELLGRSQPLGVPGDALAPPDRHHAIRPLVGYGPESSKDVLAAVRPPEVGVIEGRRERVDRAHNETLDIAVTTGLLGVMAYYVLMIGWFTLALTMLGWVGDRASRRTVISIMVTSGALAVVAAVFMDRTGGVLTFVGLALPFGVIAGVLAHVVLQCAGQGRAVERRDGTGQALGVAVLASVVGHFLAVQFAFSTAATNTYFWIYSGLLIAVSLHDQRLDDEDAGRAQKDASKIPPSPLSWPLRPEYRAASGLGFMVAVILVTLIMDLVWPETPNSHWVAWLFVTVWLAGLALLLADAARETPEPGGASPSAKVSAVVAYSAVSLGGSLVFWLVRGLSLSRWRSVTTPDTAVATAAVLADDVAMYVCCVTVVALALAAARIWLQTQDLRPARRTRLWLYLPCVLVIGGLFWFKNVNVLRADVYLTEAQRYRQVGAYETALALHEVARSLDSDEGFYYSESAITQQAMSSDGSIEASRRESARTEGERLMLEASRLNPYNPDNATNLGRYYLGLAAAGHTQYLSGGVVVLQKALALAPLDVTIHTLLARARHMTGDTQAAIDQVQRSLHIDDTHVESLSLLVDFYFDAGEFSQSLEAFGRALRVADYFRDFIEVGLENRVRGYATAGRMADMVGTILNSTSDRMPDGLVPWAIGRAYLLQGERGEAVPYFEDALPYLERAEQLADGNEEPRSRLTQVYQGLGRWEEALETLGRGNGGTWSPALLQAAFDLGEDLIEQDLYAYAAEAFETVLASNDHPHAHKVLGALYYDYLDRKDEGVAHLERALELDPGDADAPLLRQAIDQYRGNR